MKINIKNIFKLGMHLLNETFMAMLLKINLMKLYLYQNKNHRPLRRIHLSKKYDLFMVLEHSEFRDPCSRDNKTQVHIVSRFPGRKEGFEIEASDAKMSTDSR